nr:divalent metal cation transporter [Baekduia sp.]
GVGIVSAAILAAAIVPLSTAYSISETFGKKSDLDDSFGEARPFYLGFGAVMFLAVAITLIPGMPLVTLLVATQVLNAVLLLVLLPFLRRLASDRALMGDHSLSGTGRALSGIALLLVACSVVTLGLLVLS